MEVRTMSRPITVEEFKRTFPNATQSAIQRQIDQEDAARRCQTEKAACNERVRRVVDTITKQDALPALVHQPKVSRCRKGRVAIVVTITSYRHRELDEDNLIAGCKPLRDAIASSLALDDADKRLQFEYRQVVTTGTTGTHVVISRV